MKRGALVLGLLLLGAGSGASYVRSRVDNRTDAAAHCLHWPGGALTFTQSDRGDPGVAQAQTAVSTALKSWQTAMESCGSLSLQEATPTPSREVGYNATGANTNLVIFRTQNCRDVVDAGDPCVAKMSCSNTYDCWSNDYSTGIIALTTTTYSQTTGKLYDADMELNAADYYFTDVDSPVCADGAPSQSCVAFDVQNTATHEFGHALGLAHSPDSNSTMFASAPSGQTSKRTLDDGSKQFLCDAYPKGKETQDCVQGSTDVVGGCSAAGSGLLGGWGVLTFGMLRRLRRARRQRSP